MSLDKSISHSKEHRTCPNCHQEHEPQDGNMLCQRCSRKFANLGLCSHLDREGKLSKLEQEPHPWRCASMHDESGRRGLWFKVENDILTVRAGREGDDAWAEIPRSCLPEKEFNELVSALNYSAWSQETWGPCTDKIPSDNPRGH